MPHASAPRSGHTLPELVIAVAVLGILAGMALQRWRALADRTAARMAAADVAGLLASARDLAVTSSRRVTVRIDTAAGTVTLGAEGDRAPPATSRSVGALHGIRLHATRDVVTYAPLGIGWGLANARVIVRRGSAAETVFVSRLGRVRAGGGG